MPITKFADKISAIKSDKITDIVNAVAGLAPHQKSKIIAELSAAIGTGSDTAGPLTSISAAGEDVRIKLSPLQCANANPAALPLLREVKARAARFCGYDLKDSEQVDPIKLSACIQARRDKLTDPVMIQKHVDEAMTLRTQMARLRLI